MPKTTTLMWDWKSAPTPKELAAVLAPFGVHVTEPDAGLEGGVIVLSDQPLTVEQATEIFNADVFDPAG